MGVANERSRRFGYDQETVFETTAAGTFQNPAAYTKVTVNPGREVVEREENLNSFGDLYPPDPGVQTFDAAVEFDQCKETYADLKRLFTGAIGQEDSNSAITVTAGTTTQSVIKISAGTPQKIVKITGNDGKVYLIPITSFTGGTDANPAMKLPAAAVGAGLSGMNLGTAAGAVFSYVLGTAATTYQLEFDRSGQTGEVKYRGYGAAIKQASFLFELRKRIAWQFGFTASRWEKAPSGMQLANPNVRTNPFLSFACNCHLYQYSAAIAVSNATKLKKLAFSFAPKLIEETGTKALDGSSLITGSDITGFTRGQNWDGRLALQITNPDVNWHDRWDPTDTTTYYGIFCEFFSSKPAKAPNAPRLAIWFPYLQLAAEPVLEVVNGGEAQSLMFNIGRDPASASVAGYIGMTAT